MKRISSLTSLGATRRSLLGLALALPATAALGAGWPDKLVRLVVPYPPGGPTDTAARIVADRLSKRLGQQVIVDNRSGASGTIGASAVAKSPADGYTLLMLATPTLLAAHLYGARDYDIVKSFAPVATMYDLPIVLVVNPKSLPDVTDLPQLIAKAKAEKGGMNYTSAGAGSFGHLTTELLQGQGQFDMQHVPYRGTAPAVADLLGGQVPVMFSDMVGVLPHIQAGKLRAIAVGSSKRVAMLPEVKTVAEQGFPGFDATSWGGMLAPAGTPADVLKRLSDELRQVLAEKDVQDRMRTAGAIALWQSPSEMGERMRSDFDKWGKLIRDKKISMN
ncbi:tripartite tricarboxylate transporter substrate binding protein [Quisquiliibacterium transsilvanicum]|uniref:Tripartite-type tricarboxylate transporter receptor subunit TctC n=1 Tax=Quisquiliibacterium transsilvanicum TaxID=1549638 RepID=A0A7W8HFM8_9BURK|nr:tripartite tricarboxylate transporter substrate binding protein [Quisquiliibacterium transsilvanicum]MBB5270368.1 tripartite-type tricarboxylate transporter receptor subunit TctC [Quisquiliibacterium transsilvanicum]